MEFDFVMAAQNGATRVLRYNSHTSELSGFTPTDVSEFSVAPRVSKDAPLGKSKKIDVLKIQMGLSCNYACSYCSQAFQIHEAAISKMTDVDTFLGNLDNWLESEPSQIELWGGEPFVYWAKIKKLIPALKEKYPNATFGIITNGSLFDREKIDFIKKHDIGITISHDGPGQDVRGPDPLDDPEKRNWIETLIKERPNKVGINAVLTKNNYKLEEIRQWFRRELGDDIALSLEGVVNTYDAATALGTGRFVDEDLNAMSNEIFYSIANNPQEFGMGERLWEFNQSLEQKRPIEALGQKCGMDRLDTIAVDLKGNVMTCQNTGSKGVHKIGHVDDFDNIALDTSTHFAFREECMECPVVQLCKGSCMFLEGDFFKQSCKNEFAYNMGILRGALFHMTGGMVLKEIIRVDQQLAA